MNLQFYELDFLGIGAKASSGDEMAARLLVSFVDKESKRLNHIRLDIFVPKSPEITFADLQKAARSNALELLKAAVSTLEQHDIPALEKIGDEARDKHLNLLFGPGDSSD
ncbi:hypothetical protein [Bradyrhizobium sp. HKCCYLR20261]|uniref:hypothetical protein n=1 Tax=Bradyrhizobium sp. HKCCYLR20261 TaxID=3420760 RepID=UPI003EBE68F3